LKYTPKLPEFNDNISHDSPIKEFFVLLGGLLGIVVGVYILLGLAVDWVIPTISAENEKKLAGLFAGFVEEADSTSEEAVYLQQLADKLQEQCVQLPYDVRVRIIEDGVANAVALPGGTVLVFSGLLDKMTSENELAFILGHEFGHFSNRDHLKGFGRAIVFMTLSVVILGADSGVGEFLAQTIGISETGFSREQETDADEFGLAAVNCFYGHVAGSTDFFEKMKKAEDPSLFGQYFSSHPETQDRIDHIRLFSGKQGWSEKERLPLPGAIFPEETVDHE
jgi:Zn-dependent protease with chaperone function